MFQIAFARLTYIDCVDLLVVRSVETIETLVAIDARSVMLTVATHATTFKFAMNVHACLLFGDRLVEVAIIRVAIAVAFFAHERIGDRRAAPFVLLKAGAALFALCTACIVLTTARHLEGVIW